LLLLLALALACGSGEERQQAARAKFEEALAAQDAISALEAVEDLRDGLPETPESAVELARLLVRAGELNRALWLIEEAARRHPETKDLQVALAEVAVAVGNPSRALAALENVSEDDQAYPVAMLLRSRAQIVLGDLEGGLATLERAETLSPPFWFGFRVARIQAQVAERHFDAALELVKEGRSREDLVESQRTWFEVSEATVLAAQGEKEAALRLLEARTAADPGDKEAWKRRVGILVETQRADEACEELARALEARPEAGELYGLLASTQLARGDAEAAEAVLRERVERAPDAGAVQDLVDYLHHTGRTAEGAALLGDAAERFPDVESIELEYLHVAMLLTSGDAAGAGRQFEVFERRHPRDPRAEYLRARFELARGDAGAAAERLKRVAARLDRADVQHWLAVALQILGDEEAAEFRYGLAIARGQRQIPSYLGLLSMLERRGAWDQVVRQSGALLKLEPNSAIAFGFLARGLLASGHPGEAETVLRAYAERFPHLPAPAVALAAVLRSQGRPEESLALLDEAESRFESDPDLMAERAMALGLLGRGEEGLAVLSRASAAGDRASLHRARAFLLFTSGEGRGGLAEVEQALALDPADPTPLRLSGDYLFDRGDFAAAARAYERILELRPGDAEVCFRLGAARGRVGDTPGAIAAYRQAVALDEGAVAPRNNLALLLEQQGQMEEALAVAQAAFARAPSNAVVMDTLGWLYLRAGRVERAVALLEKARLAAPEAVHPRYHLAVAYRESGRTGEARELLNELQESLDAGHELRARVDEAVASLP